jgi:hypothetical protein
VRPPNIELCLRRLRASWKRQCTVVVYPPEALIDGRRCRRLAVVLLIPCHVVELTTNRMELLAAEIDRTTIAVSITS